MRLLQRKQPKKFVVTEEATVFATEEVTVEATEEATTEATEEVAVTEEATEAATAEVIEEATEEATATPSAVPTSTAADEYVIQPGDTLFSIANRYGLTVSELAEANDIVNPSRIYWGLTLQIPTAGDDEGDEPGTGGPEVTEEPTAEATEEATATPDVDDNGTLETYTVLTGG